jgi:3-isopropylmalate dehydrogenase
MLDWLGNRHKVPPMVEAAAQLEAAVDQVFAARKVKPYEFGGSDGTAAVTRAIVDALSSAAVSA